MLLCDVPLRCGSVLGVGAGKGAAAHNSSSPTAAAARSHWHCCGGVEEEQEGVKRWLGQAAGM